MKPLPPEFFAGDTPTIARELLGKHLCRGGIDGTIQRLPITETEAYDGGGDRACHAARGRTPRNEVMFGPPGVWYVYLCYGVHWMLNIVTGPEAFPAAVLIRGAGEVSGPGRLTRALGVDREHDRQPAVPATGLWIEDGAAEVPEEAVRRTPRIGINYAGKEWVDKPWRFVWQGPRNKPHQRVDNSRTD